MNEANRTDLAREWLGAYLDGELQAERRSWVESHLAGCADCRAELEQMRGLSALLQAEPLPVGGLSPDAFVAGVMEHLPQVEEPLWKRAFSFCLRYAPLFLFVAWAFTQAIGWVAAALVGLASLVPGAQNLLGAVWTLPIGIGFLPGWLPLPALPKIPGLDQVAPLAVFQLLTTAVVAILFLAWLAGVWSHRRAKGLMTADWK
ncbi:MAG TPA: zf-HC2 domain-containing protein [Anaerolineaceae bacterium]|nr:zf-HC2 domain-containing protein [Anaerolineaceae bacterium]